MWRRLIVCPACGGRKAPSVRSFPTLAEPSKEADAPVSIGMTIRQCEKCGVEFPATVSRRKYSLVPEKEVQQITKELAHLRDENKNLEQSLSELARKLNASRRTLAELDAGGELSAMMSKLNVLEEEISYFRSEKRQLEWLFATLAIAAPPK